MKIKNQTNLKRVLDDQKYQLEQIWDYQGKKQNKVLKYFGNMQVNED